MIKWGKIVTSYIHYHLEGHSEKTNNAYYIDWIHPNKEGEECPFHASGFFGTKYKEFYSFSNLAAAKSTLEAIDEAIEVKKPNVPLDKELNLC
jgi:hypothetical protein